MAGLLDGDPWESSFGPASLLWRGLPQNVRDAYKSVPSLLAELSPGASVRDMVDASGRFMGGLLHGHGWEAAGAGANLLTAMAGLAPGMRAVEKAGKFPTLVERADFDKALVKEAKAAGYGRPLTETEEAQKLATPQVKQAVKDTREAVRSGDRSLFPELANRYPEVGTPVIRADEKTGKQYLAKAETPETKVLDTARKEIDKQIKAGNYDPMFPVAQRFDVRGNYGPFGDTASLQPVDPKTIAKWNEIARDPEAARLMVDAFNKGKLTFDQSGNWYHVGQMEEPFLKKFGPGAGEAEFKNVFSTPMAVTTAGQSPQANFLTGPGYGNFMRGQGLRVPEKSWQVPYPIGGRYLPLNLQNYNRTLHDQGGVIDMIRNPKPFDFDTAFLGNVNAAVMDEQMTKGGWPAWLVKERGWPSIGNQPPYYGPFTSATRDVARGQGVDPRGFQDVGWAGFKDYAGKPMVQEVNEAMERTSRITGQKPSTVYDRFMGKETPLYSLAPFAALGVPGLLDEQDTGNF